MKNEVLNTINDDIISKKKIGKFDVLILGIGNKLFSNIFSLIINDPNIKHKYLNNYDLCLRESINFPQNFENILRPEILDKLMNIDILILSYEVSDILSFENLKTFYHLYYQKLDEKYKPINVIIVESNNNIDFKYIDSDEGKKISELYNGFFCDSNTNEESFEKILINCIDKLRKIYNTENNLFDYKLKDKSKELNYHHIAIYGHNDIKNTFITNLLKLECNVDYQKEKDSMYIINYKNKDNNNKNYNKIIIELVKEKDYIVGSQCSLFLYDEKKLETYNLIRNIIRAHILNHGAKYKKIYKLFSINTNNSSNKEVTFKDGKDLAKEIGADFEQIDLVNNNKILNTLFNNIVNQIYELSILIKNNNNNKDLIVENDNKKNKILFDDNFYVLSVYDSPSIFIDDFIDKMDNKVQSYSKGKFIFTKCPECYNSLNIQIKDSSNLILLQCTYCNSEPMGLDINQFELNKKRTNQKFYCNKCYKCLYYDYSSKKLVCENCQYNYKSVKNVSIPVYLKDYYCETHNLFNQYYLKYSKKGICKNCLEQKYKRGYFIEKFVEDDIRMLIKNKNFELEKEKNFFISIKKKFDNCIKDLQLKFNEIMNIKQAIYKIKKDMIQNLELIENNYTLISNVKNLQFNYMKNFNYNENDSIENKILNIFNFLGIDEDINNIYFDRNKEKNLSMKINGPYNNIVPKEKIQNNDINITDMWSINENKLICVSYNDGKAKIFDTNINENSYPLCIIKEYEPNQGVNSLYVSKNKKDVIYLNGYEKIVIIQMKDNYKSYDKLNVINKNNSIFYQVIELPIDKKLMVLMDSNILKLINFENDIYSSVNTNQIDMTNITNLFVKEEEKGKTILYISNITKNIISLFFSEDDDLLGLNIIKRSNYSVNTGLTLLTQDSNIKENKNSTKIYELKQNESNSIEKNKNNFIISKEYLIPKNYELLGSLSEEKNLLLMNYANNNIHLFCIFDFNICQFIKSFKIHNEFSCPKLFMKIKYDIKVNKTGIIICDENINLIQYFYDEENSMIYFLKIIENRKKMFNIPVKLIYLKQNIIILCNKNNYFLLSE